MGQKKTLVKKFDVVMAGIPYKLIVITDLKGVIQQVMEKPKLEQTEPSIHLSGCHIFPFMPHENHYDHWHNGKEWKERGKLDNFLPMPYVINGSGLGIK